MGIGAGTGVGGMAQPPQIRETETTAFVEGTKKEGAILPAGTSEVIAFTKALDDQISKYRSEPDLPTPSSHSSQTRLAALMELVEEGKWQPIYQELIDSLPPEIREQLLRENQLPFAERDPSFVALDQLLTTTAIAIAWLAGVTGPMEPDSPEEANYLLNQALPYIMLRGSIAQAKTVLNAAELWLEQIGPNNPNYDALTNFVRELKELLSELNALRLEIEQGDASDDLTLRLEELANKLNQLNDLFESTGLGEELPILKTTLNNLAVISSAWALGLDSSPLLIGMYIAFTGSSQETSNMGIFGPGFHAFLDGLNEGLLDIFSFGTLSELEELDGLCLDFLELRDA